MLWLIVNSVLASYFYTYAYANPDEGSCYANGQGAVAATSTTLTGEVTNVSKELETWFMMGFILSCSIIAYYLLGFLNYKCGNASLIAELVTAIGYFSVLGTLGWVVYGTLLQRLASVKGCSGSGVENNGQAPYQW